MPTRSRKPRDRTEADVDIKTKAKEEPEMKSDVVAGFSARSEGPYTSDRYNSEYYDSQETYDSEYDAEYEQDAVVKSERKPRGFISRYTGPKFDGLTVPRSGGVGVLSVTRVAS